MRAIFVTEGWSVSSPYSAESHHDPEQPLRDVLQDAGGRDAEGLTLPPLPDVEDRSPVREISTPARRELRRVIERPGSRRMSRTTANRERVRQS